MIEHKKICNFQKDGNGLYCRQTTNRCDSCNERTCAPDCPACLLEPEIKVAVRAALEEVKGELEKHKTAQTWSGEDGIYWEDVEAVFAKRLSKRIQG